MEKLNPKNKLNILAVGSLVLSILSWIIFYIEHTLGQLGIDKGLPGYLYLYSYPFVIMLALLAFKEIKVRGYRGKDYAVIALVLLFILAILSVAFAVFSD